MESGPIYASAARTTAQTGSTMINAENAKGILVHLDVTAASGTGGLTLAVKGIDPVSGNATALLTAGAAVTATGTKSYLLYPGASGGSVTTAVSGALPYKYRVDVAVGDASSNTYSVGYTLLA